jgi:hypothetical protein
MHHRIGTAIPWIRHHGYRGDMKGAGGLRQQVRGHVVRMMPACVVAAL